MIATILARAGCGLAAKPEKRPLPRRDVLPSRGGEAIVERLRPWAVGAYGVEVRPTVAGVLASADGRTIKAPR